MWEGQGHCHRRRCSICMNCWPQARRSAKWQNCLGFLRIRWGGLQKNGSNFLMAQITEPSITKNSFNCPHCGALAHQHWYDIYISNIKDNGCPDILTMESIEEISKEVPKNEKDIIEA